MRFVVENYGDSDIARRFGVTRYPAIFVNDVLLAKPKDFGFYGKGEGSGDGRYTPWKSAASHEKFQTDLRRMIELTLKGDKSQIAERTDAAETAAAEEIVAMPSLQWTDLSGKPIAADDLSDRVRLVEFWATWCPPCRGTLAWLGRLKQKYGDRIAILAVAIESEEKNVRQIADGLNIPLRWTMGSPEIARAFGDLGSVPTLFLFDQKGNTSEIFYGAPADLHQKAEQQIESLLQTAKK